MAEGGYGLPVLYARRDAIVNTQTNELYSGSRPDLPGRRLVSPSLRFACSDLACLEHVRQLSATTALEFRVRFQSLLSFSPFLHLYATSQQIYACVAVPNVGCSVGTVHYAKVEQ